MEPTGKASVACKGFLLTQVRPTENETQAGKNAAQGGQAGPGNVPLVSPRGGERSTVGSSAPLHRCPLPTSSHPPSTPKITLCPHHPLQNPTPSEVSSR